jgi:hypothetical protein
MPSHDYVPCYLGDEVYAVYNTKLQQVGLCIGERSEPDVWIDPSVFEGLARYVSTGARRSVFGAYNRLTPHHLLPAHRAALGIN